MKVKNWLIVGAMLIFLMVIGLSGTVGTHEEQIEHSKKIQKRIIEILKDGKMTRNEIMNASGIPWTTLYDNLHKLEKSGLVEKKEMYEYERGRPIVVWSIK